MRFVQDSVGHFFIYKLLDIFIFIFLYYDDLWEGWEGWEAMGGFKVVFSQLKNILNFFNGLIGFRDGRNFGSNFFQSFHVKLEMFSFLYFRN
jgi:hypothetical protein